LLIKGGEVFDPSQKLRGVRDIGIRNGVIEAVQAEIPVERALKVMSASGRLVTPGLIDLHTHVYPYGSAIGIPADELVPYQGTTTVVSAGDAGANNFAAFRRYTVPQTRTRLYAFVHIANIGLAGFPVPELYNIDYAQPEAAARTLAENADIAIGIKVRMSENVIAQNGLEPLKRAIRACEMVSSSAKIMCHIGGVESAQLMSQILDLLRPRDILTHCYSGAPNIAGKFTNIVQDGKLLPAALEAKKRGVHFDVGHGGGSFDYTVAEAAIAQERGPTRFPPTSTCSPGNSPGMPYLTWVMSKFLNMGFSLEQVITMATINAARAIDKLPKLGTLQVGAPADVVTLLDVQRARSNLSTRATTSERARCTCGRCRQWQGVSHSGDRTQRHSACGRKKPEK
jgi:dihydroorotase